LAWSSGWQVPRRPKPPGARLPLTARHRSSPLPGGRSARRSPSPRALRPRTLASLARPSQRDRGGRGKFPSSVAAHGLCCRPPCAWVTVRSRDIHPALRGTGRRVRSFAQVVRSSHPLHRLHAFSRRISILAFRRSRAGSLFWGCQSTPLRRFRSKSPLGRPRVLPPPTRRVGRARPDRVPPSWFLTTSTVCASPVASGCCTRSRPWGSPCFRRLRADLLTTQSCPPEPSSSIAAARRRPEGPRPAGDRHRRARVSTRPDVHRSPCLLAVAAAQLALVPPVDLEALLHDRSCAARRTFQLDPGPCSPGLAPRRCRRCRRAAMSPPWRAPVSRRSS